MGQKQKTEKKKEKKLNDGNNNGQATHGARKHAWRTQAQWRTQAAWANLLSTFSHNKLRMYIKYLTISFVAREVHIYHLCPFLY